MSIETKNKVTYLGIFLVGVLTHIYMFTNKFYNEDDINNLTVQASQICLGRWLEDVENSLFFEYSIPSVNGILTVLILTVAAVYVCKFFDIENHSLILLCGCLFVTFPVVACNFTYMSGAYIYALALLFAILFNYFLLKSTIKAHKIVAVLFLVLSLSLYQVYICLAVGMFWIYLIIFTCDKKANRKFKETVIYTLNYFIWVAIAFIIYYITVKISLMLTGTVIASYQNLDQIFTIHIYDYFMGMLKTYYRFIMFCLGCFYGKVSYHLILLHVVMIVISLLLLFKLYRKNNLRVNAIVIIEIVLLPMFIESAEIMAATAQSRHMLMRFASVLWYIIPVIILEKSGFGIFSKESKEKKALVITMSLIACIGFFICNLAYYKCNLSTSNMEALLTRVATSIEMTDVYVPNETKVWIDSTQGEPLYTNNMDDFPEITNLMGVNDEYRFFNISRLKPIMKNYLYFESIDPSEAEIKMIKETDEYKQMNCYPLEGSIKWINGILVVKMTD